MPPRRGIISWLAGHKRSFFIGTTLVFVVGIFMGLGSYMFSKGGVTGAVASVGAVEIPYSRFLWRVDRYLNMVATQGKELDEKQKAQLKSEILRDMIVEELLRERAEELGLRVTDQDVARAVRANPAFQRGGRFDQGLYFSIVASAFRETPAQYESDMRRGLQAQGFRNFVSESAKFLPAEEAAAYAALHGGSLKNFKKDQASFHEKFHQQLTVDLLNYELRRLSGRVVIRSFLKERESGS